MSTLPGTYSLNRMERAFQQDKHRLLEVIRAHNSTEYGTTRPFPIPTEYEEFCSLPPLEDEALAADPERFHISSDHDIEFMSSGSSGRPKRIFRPANDRAIPLPSDVDQLIRSRRTVFAHSKRYQLESFYWILDKTYREDYAAEPVEYDDVDSAIDAVRHGDVICVYEYPSALYKFLSYLRQGLDRNLLTHEAMEQKDFIVEISGEPLTVGDLEYVIRESRSIFGKDPILWVTYGLAEAGGVAYCDHREGEARLVYRVATHRVFVEVLDPYTRLPVVGQQGEVVITALRTGGTVILRYRTGDLGTLRFDGDEPTLERLDRPSAVFVAGSQFSVQGIVRDLRESLGVLARLNVARSIDNETGTEKVDVAIHVEIARPGVGPSALERFVRDRIVEEAELHAEIDGGVVELDVATAKELSGRPHLPPKSWSVKQVERQSGLG